jgi:hypothetical protein
VRISYVVLREMKKQSQFAGDSPLPQPVCSVKETENDFICMSDLVV